ncbi:hypothetical protein PAXRUDRAFT_305593 [Paxillus rubicundulus Ve08.2h10]|uniref:Uncharacterized protein n=1 Tax=Paxillus rubicundulus Ve08.2h10 TaxID=930991 RepID=A0A0D0D5K0_9AGAM|nr:hypothetical protein PAXRUDRAFT_305593 [Paxillus rubicundulus Ve08.2h10]
MALESPRLSRHTITCHTRPTTIISKNMVKNKSTGEQKKVAENMSKLQRDIVDIQRASAPKKRQVDALPILVKLIPKPPGLAGRRNGYNLQDVMHLGDNREKYNRLVKAVCTITHAVIEPHKTW